MDILTGCITFQGQKQDCFSLSTTTSNDPNDLFKIICEFGVNSQLAQFVVKELKQTKVVEEKKTNDVL